MLRLLLAAGQASAHLALWDPAMYGYEPDKPWAHAAKVPLDALAFKDWWFHGFIDQPPEPGKFLELPSGGVFRGEIACNKRYTTWGANDPRNPNPEPPTEYACDPKGDKNCGPLHAHDVWPQPDLSKLTDVKGTALAIAYESDVHKIQPEDFVVITTNQSSPWKREVDYHIPGGLPPCPPGGCHCMWGWVHSGYERPENYFLGYRCTVTNADPNASPLARPQIARKCPADKSNCTIGAKQPHYWWQKERNNNFQGRSDPPYYNHEFGFADGAQTDIWEVDTREHSNDIWAPGSIRTATAGENPAAGTPAPHFGLTGKNVWTTTFSNVGTAMPQVNAHTRVAKPEVTSGAPPVVGGESPAEQTLSIPNATPAAKAKCRRRRR